MILWNREFNPETFSIPAEVLAALMSHGFEDESWHNDVAPHFTRPHQTENKEYQFWVDAVKREDREFTEHARFVLVFTGKDAHDCAPIFETEFPDVAVAALRVVFG